MSSPTGSIATYESLVAVIDFEASCLPQNGSYPIEVAVSFLNGSTSSWLIRPLAGWMSDGFWDPGAQRRHGLSIEYLMENGIDVGVVADELFQAVGGLHLLSDFPAADSYWLSALYAAAGRKPPGTIGSLYKHLLSLTLSGSGLAGEAEVDEAMELARRRFPEEHRASADARRNLEAVRILLPPE